MKIAPQVLRTEVTALAAEVAVLNQRASAGPDAAENPAAGAEGDVYG